MQTLKQPRSVHAVFGLVPPAQKSGRPIFVLCLAALLPWLMGCKKDASFEAIETDANGYLCSKCGAKFYTDRSVFLALKCPKCGQDGLVGVVAFFCPKDNHLTLTGRQANAACEKCGAPLSGMRLPREKDLKAWGATQVPK